MCPDFLQLPQGARQIWLTPVKSSRQIFPKRARLLKHADFERVYQTGKRHFCGNLTFFFIPTTPNPAEENRVRVRVGLTVGRALGGAVERNRIKRRVRAAVRKHLQELLSPVDIVINPKKSAANVDFAQLEKEVHLGFAAIERGEGPSSKGPRVRGKNGAGR